MQDIHAIGGGAAPPGVGGRLFTGGSGGGGDRRLRPHNSQGHQALKCPRCDSLNTKFCYYNNYNLSQPRHFCKSCRRYWTKGGVLRNVPVGGGCRKAKRSKPKASANSSEVAAPAREADSNSHSSSESSSLTVTTTAAKNCAAAGSSGEVASATVNSSNSPSNLLNFQGSSRFFVPQINVSSGFDQQQQQQPLIDPSSVSSNGQIFQEIGSFTSLMTTSNDPAMLGFNMADVAAYRLQQNDQGSVVEEQCSNPMVGTTGDDELKMEQISSGFLDQTGHIGFTGMQQQSRVSNGGLAGLDWQINGGGGGGGGDQGLFDFTGTVDQAYWVQNQWAADNDQSLNFPPLV